MSALPQPTELPKLILLVDDIPDHASQYFEALSRHGFRVQLARTGENALRLAQANLPDCAVIDLRLPDMTGWELCQRLKSGDGGAVRVIVLTTEVSQSCALDSSKAGCNAWLAHPTAPEALVGTVTQVLGMDTDGPVSSDEALIDLTFCAGCGSDRVRSALRVGTVQYYCCRACGFCWRAEILATAR
jgi:DNA-binding response OmpR family regulator